MRNSPRHDPSYWLSCGIYRDWVSESVATIAGAWNGRGLAGQLAELPVGGPLLTREKRGKLSASGKLQLLQDAADVRLHGRLCQ